MPVISDCIYSLSLQYEDVKSPHSQPESDWPPHIGRRALFLNKVKVFNLFFTWSRFDSEMAANRSKSKHQVLVHQNAIFCIF